MTDEIIIVNSNLHESNSTNTTMTSSLSSLLPSSSSSLSPPLSTEPHQATINKNNSNTVEQLLRLHDSPSQVVEKFIKTQNNISNKDDVEAAVSDTSCYNCTLNANKNNSQKLLIDSSHQLLPSQLAVLPLQQQRSNFAVNLHAYQSSGSATSNNCIKRDLSSNTDKSAENQLFLPYEKCLGHAKHKCHSTGCKKLISLHKSRSKSDTCLNKNTKNQHWHTFTKKTTSSNDHIAEDDGTLTSPLNVRSDDINDPFIVCLKEKSQYFYDSLVAHDQTRTKSHKFPFKKSTSVEHLPVDKLQYASDIVNSGGNSHFYKGPETFNKKPVASNGNGAKSKQHYPRVQQYGRKVSGIGSPFEKKENIEEEEEEQQDDDALRFICESGILGSPVEIMGNAISGIFRKQSKVTTSFQEPVNKEQIRKNSLVLMKQISDMRRKSLTEDYEYLRNTAVPNLKRELSEYEIKVATYEDEVVQLRNIIKARDDEILKLKTEIHKLKSVLQQTSATSPITQDAPQDLSTIQETLLEHQDISLYEPNANYEVDPTQTTTTTQADVNFGGQQKRANAHLTPLPMPLTKKQGVSGESCDTQRQSATDISIQKYEKDFRSKQLIKDAIMDNDFLKHIDSLQIRELVESMFSREFSTGDYVIREGEAGAHLFVSAEGEFEVIKNGTSLGKIGPGKAFGELAILYNCTRTATIRALTNSRVWVLDRRIFQHLMMRTGIQRMQENTAFLKSVPLLKNLNNDVLTKIADVLEVEFYPAGTYIIRQGASGDTFFLISQGTVKVTQRVPGAQIEEEIRILGRGEYFGEQALIKEDKRTANIIAMSPGVECLTLDRDSFTQLIGNFCEEIHFKDYGDQKRIFASKGELIQPTASATLGETKQEMLDIDLWDLNVVATLGIGGFGRVELVKCEKNGNLRTFALKCLKKKHIVETKQEEHVYNERKIMLSCKTPFICRLYRTYRDSKYVYMLLEACLGGEVWTILRDKGNFDDNTTQFIIACVLEAFDYLHSRGIVYRDLKPENLMLDSNGYVKLVDFGFAKHIGLSNKTWTFCGTPEYVAPEIILNRGHDRAVDCWSLGILIHELLTGTPPFAASDPMKTYNLILKGIDMIDFPRHMSRTAISLIKRLCRDAPAERLGYQRAGIQEIKKHKWFAGFDWDGLSSLTLQPPILPKVTGPTDSSNFDEFPSKTEVPPDETSGWDSAF
ncbi:cGMP-dependent protein kinase, isozyme 1 isoform X2 [Culicoides brevitarsis]|uniref:cGMP-dependent protein kinase, isozyme 1 isoform X2 n=1 Tax=Culicoides brevitarsis TaxID=469753 RepID=UPI00307C0586